MIEEKLSRSSSSPPHFPLGLTEILFAAALLLCFAVAYAPVLQSLVHTWGNSDDYSHGFFIVPICLYIIWQKKDELMKLVWYSSPWGLVLFFSSLLLYILADSAGIRTLSSLTIIPVLAGIIWYLLGGQVLRALMFPLFLLLFMVPVPSQIYSSLTIPLQLIVSKVSVSMTSGVGIPIFAEGNVLQLPDRTLEIVEACSGLRSLLSLFVLSLVYGYFSLQSNLLRGFLFVSAIPVAILVNIVRVSLIITAFYYFNFDLSTGSAHTWLGVGVFFLALVFIFLEKGILGIWDSSVDVKL